MKRNQPPAHEPLLWSAAFTPLQLRKLETLRVAKRHKCRAPVHGPDARPTLEVEAAPETNDGPQGEPFYFEFSHPTARSVRIVGSFNDWQPEAEPMFPMGQGYWLKKAILPPGTHEYCLIVDDQGTPDPLARESVPNPFGGKNSVLKVAGGGKAAHRLDAEHLQPKTANT